MWTLETNADTISSKEIGPKSFEDFGGLGGLFA